MTPFIFLMLSQVMKGLQRFFAMTFDRYTF